MPYMTVYRSKTDGLAHSARNEHYAQCGQRLGERERVGGDNPLTTERTCAVCFPAIGKASPQHQVVYLAQYWDSIHEGSLQVLCISFDRDEADQALETHREQELQGGEPRRAQAWVVEKYEVGGHATPGMDGL